MGSIREWQAIGSRRLLLQSSQLSLDLLLADESGGFPKAGSSRHFSFR